MKGRMLRAAFFRRNPLTCARALIGTELVWGKCVGKIVETEAYFAENDEACHTFSRPSARDFVEQNEAGAAYVYFSYGAHWMLNVLVKSRENGFVLVRALEPLRGIELMKKRRRLKDEVRLCSGPGKLTQALQITNRHHKMDLCRDPQYCFLSPRNGNVQVVADARIGISRSAHHPWRFTLQGSKFVSRPAKL